MASAGVEGYTCQCSGASPSFFLSSWTCRASQLLQTPPPPPRFRPVQLSHAWPSLGIYSGCFQFLTSTLLSCTVISQSLPSSIPCFSFICPITSFYFITYRSISYTFLPFSYILSDEVKDQDLGKKKKKSKTEVTIISPLGSDSNKTHAF